MRLSTALAYAAALSGGVLHADVFTVGPGGTHPFGVQSAVNRALATPGGPHEIRIAEGTFEGRVLIDTTSEVALEISGGWKPWSYKHRTGTTTLSTPLPCDTGAFPCALVSIRRSAGSLSVHHLGLTASQRPCLEVLLTLTAAAELADNFAFKCQDRRALASYPGAGLYAYVRDRARLTVARTRFERNNGAAAFMESGEGGLVELLDSVIRDNRTTYSHALVVQSYGGSIARFERNTVSGNTSTTATVGLGADSFGAATQGSGNTIRANIAPTQLVLGAAGASVRLTDTVVAEGSGVGVLASADLNLGPSAVVELTNVTIANNLRGGLEVVVVPGRPGLPEGSVALSNSILYGNLGADLDGTPTTSQANWIGGADPGFVVSASGDFHLRSDSPAVDAGDAVVPGGLGTYDIDGEARVSGAAVDIGADEVVLP